MSDTVEIPGTVVIDSSVPCCGSQLRLVSAQPRVAQHHRWGPLMGRHFLVILMSLVVLISVQPAIACSCVALDPVVGYRNNGVVVLAKIVGLETTPDLSPWKVTLVILKSWKGPWPPNTTIKAQTPGPRGACGLFIHVQDKFLIYSNDPSTLVNVALCNTVRGDDVAKHIRSLDALSRSASSVGQGEDR